MPEFREDDSSWQVSLVVSFRPQDGLIPACWREPPEKELKMWQEEELSRDLYTLLKSFYSASKVNLAKMF
jgi:hypothetical protein